MATLRICKLANKNNQLRFQFISGIVQQKRKRRVGEDVACKFVISKTRLKQNRFSVVDIVAEERTNTEVLQNNFYKYAIFYINNN